MKQFIISNMYSNKLNNCLMICFQHVIFYDNCHSHVATALNIMNYGGSKNWNMVKLAFYMMPYGKYVR